MLFKKILFALTIALLAMNVSAQKFGHLNVGNLLLLMPETNAANDSMKVFQDSLVNTGESRAKAVEAEIQAFVKEYQAGNLTPAQSQKQQAELEAKRKVILDYEQEVAQLVAQKREMLLGPILEKLQQAINDVGKEQGYYMIFDTSVINAILFAKESDDVTPLVKAKLAIE